MKEVPNIDLRREDTKKSRNGILIGQCAQFLIHPEPKLMHLADLKLTTPAIMRVRSSQALAGAIVCRSRRGRQRTYREHSWSSILAGLGWHSTRYELNYLDVKVTRLLALFLYEVIFLNHSVKRRRWSGAESRSNPTALQDKKFRLLCYRTNWE